MDKGIILQQIEEFILCNGWKENRDPEDDHITYDKSGNFSIALSNDGIVFIADEGDVMHFSLNYETYYAVIGYMIVHRLIGMDFKIPEFAR